VFFKKKKYKRKGFLKIFLDKGIIEKKLPNPKGEQKAV
jgi:hypothetical protein